MTDNIKLVYWWLMAPNYVFQSSKFGSQPQSKQQYEWINDFFATYTQIGVR